MALIHRDYSQQEVRIAGLLTGCPALRAACEAGDVYLGIAQQLGFSIEDRPGLRDLFKVVVLGILYGLSAQSLALYARVLVHEAIESLAWLRARFHVFEEYAATVADHAGLDLVLSTAFGWTVH